MCALGVSRNPLIFFFIDPKGILMAKHYRRRRKYGLFNFIFDIIMICLTAGFWLIWIFVREMRNR